MCELQVSDRHVSWLAKAVQTLPLPVSQSWVLMVFAHTTSARHEGFAQVACLAVTASLSLRKRHTAGHKCLAVSADALFSTHAIVIVIAAAYH